MATVPDSIAIIGLGLIGSSIARAVRHRSLPIRITGFDLDEGVCEQIQRLELIDRLAPTPEDAVRDAKLVILCVPVGAMEGVASSLEGQLRPDAILSDVGSSKRHVAAIVRRACPTATIVPAHPIAGSDRSGPVAGRQDLFEGRWCIMTPDRDCPAKAVEQVASFWTALGARVELMDDEEHDLILAATSHVPHLLAFATMLALAEMEGEAGTDIMTYSGGGFRDFSRIAAADPIVWRDTLLSNRDAIGEVLARCRHSLDRLETMMKLDQVSDLTETLSAIRFRRLQLHAAGQQEV